MGDVGPADLYALLIPSLHGGEHSPRVELVVSEQHNGEAASVEAGYEFRDCSSPVMAPKSGSTTGRVDTDVVATPVSHAVTRSSKATDPRMPAGKRPSTLIDIRYPSRCPAGHPRVGFGGDHQPGNRRPDIAFGG